MKQSFTQFIDMLSDLGLQVVKFENNKRNSGKTAALVLFEALKKEEEKS